MTVVLTMNSNRYIDLVMGIGTSQSQPEFVDANFIIWSNKNYTFIPVQRSIRLVVVPSRPPDCNKILSFGHLFLFFADDAVEEFGVQFKFKLKLNFRKGNSFITSISTHNRNWKSLHEFLLFLPMNKKRIKMILMCMTNFPTWIRRVWYRSARVRAHTQPNGMPMNSAKYRNRL